MDIQPPKAHGGLATVAPKKSTSAEAGAGPPTTASVTAEPAENGEPSLRMSGLTQRVMSGSAVDSAKVARIAQQVRDGSYRIDPQRIADKMLSMEQDLP